MITRKNFYSGKEERGTFSGIRGQHLTLLILSNILSLDWRIKLGRLKRDQGIEGGSGVQNLYCPEWSEDTNLLIAIQNAIKQARPKECNVRTLIHFSKQQDERVRKIFKTLLGEQNDWVLCGELQVLLSGKCHVRGLSIRINECGHLCVTYPVQKSLGNAGGAYR